MEEIWRPIPNFLGYEVSNMGYVRSYKKNLGHGKWIITKKPQRILSPSISHGYKHVNLCKNGKRYGCKVHQLVARAFLGPRPKTLEVCHNDGDRLNNRLDNIRYDTHFNNAQDAVDHGRYQIAGQKKRKFNAKEIEELRISVANGMSIKDAADKYDVSHSYALDICKGKRYKDYPGPILDSIPHIGFSEKRGETSKYRGVSWYYPLNKWRAAIWEGGRGGGPKHLGYFKKQIDAARAYDKAAKEKFGAFAILNFPDE